MIAFLFQRTLLFLLCSSIFTALSAKNQYLARFLIVDVVEVMGASLELKALQTSIQKRTQSHERRFEAALKTLLTAQQKLDTEGLPAKQFQEKYLALQKQIQACQETAQKERRELDTQHQADVYRVQKAITQAIDCIRRKHKAWFVFHQAALPSATSRVRNITADVIVAVNDTFRGSQTSHSHS